MRRGGVAVGLALALLLAAPRAVAREPQPLVVALIVNGLPRGEYFVVRDVDGAFLLALDEALGLSAQARDLVPRQLDGVAHVKLDDLPGARLDFDEPTLTLTLLLAPDAFAAQRYSLRRAPRAAGTSRPDPSLLLNYRMAYDAGDDDHARVSLATEQALRVDRWLLRNQHLLRHEGDDTRALRYESQLLREDAAGMHRLSLGDSFTRAGDLGRSVPVGGLSWSRAFELQPYFVPQPSVRFAGAVELPSRVEMYVGGNRVFERELEPGPFEIADFDYYSGLQNVVVVIRDALGRERVVDGAYYFSDQVLSAGLHDFSYHLGRLREGFGISSGRYGETAWSAYHRYGLTDWLTLGLQGEGTPDYGNLGAALALRHDRLGVLAAAASASRNEAGRDGAAYTARYSYNADRILFAAAWRRHTPDYAVLRTDRLQPPPPQRDLAASLTWSTARAGSFSLGYSLRSAPALRRETFSLGYSRRLLRGLSLLLNARHIGADGTDVRALEGIEWSLSLFYLPTRGPSAAAAWQRDASGAHGRSLQIGSVASARTGLSYRVSAGQRRDDAVTTDTMAPALQYDGRYGTVGAELTAVRGAVHSTRYTAALAGSLAAVGGHVALSRPIADSFALARIEPPLADVRVYQSNREVGRTNARGFALVPDLSAQVDNQISIEPQDIPMTHSLAEARRTVTPIARSGVLVRFTVARLQAVAGRIHARRAGLPEPLSHRWVELDDGSRFMTGSDGAFYVENLPAGAYAARVPAADCGFLLMVPDRDEALIELDEALLCEPPSLPAPISGMNLTPALAPGAG